MKKKMSKLMLIRLCLSGSIAGVALVGIVAPFFGIDVSHAREAIGGVVGFGMVAAFKLAHVI